VRKYKILLSSPENILLSHRVIESLAGEESRLFRVETDESSLTDYSRYDLVVILSDRADSNRYFMSSSVRQSHWIVPPGMGERAFSEEVRLYFKEIIQTFRSPTTEKESLRDESWRRYYQEEKTAWDLGEPSPPFVRLYQEKGIQKGKIAIPGCGKGHEVLYFAREGFEVTAIDFADEALDIVKKRLDESGLKAELIKDDFLKLSPRLNGSFDCILEQTCYCAIEPLRRADYVRSAYRLLRDGGQYIALFYDIDNLDGPPFGTSREDVRHRFSPYFKLEGLEKSARSHERRAGKEWLARFLKKN
jgi:SAM-dependent methyltransferase